jgi:isocitrate dehydrogenase kinase/phosphatase
MLYPILQMYFQPSKEVREIIAEMEEKYQLVDRYDNICVLFYRGNDKITETPLCSYDDFFGKAREVERDNPGITFLIQSDETEFIERAKQEFPNHIHFRDETRDIPKASTSVDRVFSNQNYEFSKKYLAITIIMSKCKHVVCGSGNCSLWIFFYRNHKERFHQFLDWRWV